MKIKVIYGDRQAADAGDQPVTAAGYTASPSAHKPRQMAAALRDAKIDGLEIEFVEPEPLAPDDFKLAHDPRFVDGVLGLQLSNGFGTKSQSVADSLPYTNGAMYTAARLATPQEPTCALVSGFHHAGYHGWEGLGWFCTFNGLVIAAAKLAGRVAIIDCDMHWGNGTDDILSRIPDLREKILHITFGKHFHDPSDAATYLQWLEPGGRVYEHLAAAPRPGVILYQSGADVHVDDPYGGVLTAEQMYERDLRVFRVAKSLGVPLAWNLAGGYQVDPDGGIGKVLELHLNTFRACVKVYGEA